MQIILNTEESDESLKLVVEQALKELERRTGQEFQVVVKAKGAAPSQAPRPAPQQSYAPQPQPQPQAAQQTNNMSAQGSRAVTRAAQMEAQMGKVDLSIIGNPKKSAY